MSMRTQKSMWPAINSKAEDAIFTIILHPDIYLFRSGGKIQGDVYIQFKDTKEEICFQSLKVYLKENVNLPEGVTAKKNVTAKVIEEKTLVDRDKSSHIYNYYISEINESNEVRISFEFHLPVDLASSFNSKQITTCYELRAELSQLNLCGEMCDMSTSQPIEIKELITDSSDSSNSAQLQQAIGEKLITFSANSDKSLYHTDDEMKIELYLDIPELSEVMIDFSIVQTVELTKQSHWENVVIKTKEIYPLQNGMLNTSSLMYLESSSFSSQPSVSHSKFIKVSYVVRILAYLRDESIELEIPFTVEREHALSSSYQKIVSRNGLPLLPLTITVNELKTDGLQSYIPLKQCYENRRLSVRRGNLDGLNAVLTIVNESYQPYTQNQKIKGYVYLKIENAENIIKFGNLIILLVGVRTNKNGSTLRSRNGEMFLYERKILKGDMNGNISEITLSEKSGLMVTEFEFDLSSFNKNLPPTFNSDDVSISYELKADVFNLCIEDKKASLYTTLPIIIKEDNTKVNMDTSGIRSVNKVNGKEVLIFLSTDKPVYQHNDIIQTRVNIDNKSKRQLTVMLRLVQVVESVGIGHVINETVLSKPILLLILPKSKLLTTETISLKNTIFHHQPSVTRHDDFYVSYKLTIDVPLLNSPDLKAGVPIKILRRYGHAIKELTREGYPLLPVTLEFYGKTKPSIPSYLKDYEKKNIIKVLNSTTYSDRWKGWKLK